MTVDEKYVALPKLYGAPAYARPPAPVEPRERPIDLDELPLIAEQTPEERALAEALFGQYGSLWLSPPLAAMPRSPAAAALRAPGAYVEPAPAKPSLAKPPPSGAGGNGSEPALAPRVFNLRGFTDRLRRRE